MTSKWSSQPLSAGMKSVYGAAKENLAELKKEMAGINAQISRLQDQVGKAANDSKLVSEITQSAASSGIYHLNLAPEKGAWDSRILAASGIPPRDQTAFSAIIANIVIAADVGSVATITNTISDIAKAVIPEAKEFFSLPAMPPLESVSIPSIPPPAPIPENEWKSATMGDIFPSVATEMASSATKNAAKGEQAKKALAEIITKQDEIVGQLTDAEKLVNDLENSNVFNFIAEPESTPSSDWYSRLTDSGGDATPPVSDASMFSGGTITVIIAPDFESLVSKFNNYSLKGQ